MKVIIDTNILFSALYKPDSPAGDLIILAFYEKVTLYAPETVKEELIRNLREKLHYSEREIEEATDILPVEWIEEQIYSSQLEIAKEYIGQQSDEPIIACALTQHLDIVSGDKHFHPLKKEGIQVWQLTDFLKHVD